ncbi:MAG: hypothetical protein R3Y28_01245 [Candidatus Gastranaerophilales bacterium]
MKKTIAKICLSSLLLTMTPNYVFAKKTEIPKGTGINIINENAIDNDEIELDEFIEFIARDNIEINGEVAIKAGTSVLGQVTKKRNNFIFGVPGKIEINNFRIVQNDNDDIMLRGSIKKTGASRYWCIAGLLFIVTIPLIFIKGDDAKINSGTYKRLYTLDLSTIEIDE